MRYLRRKSSNLWTGPSSIQTGCLRVGTVGMTIAMAHPRLITTLEASLLTPS
jgi:hypothetical protein